MLDQIVRRGDPSIPVRELRPHFPGSPGGLRWIWAPRVHSVRRGPWAGRYVEMMVADVLHRVGVPGVLFSVSVEVQVRSMPAEPTSVTPRGSTAISPREKGDTAMVIARPRFPLCRSRKTLPRSGAAELQPSAYILPDSGPTSTPPFRGGGDVRQSPEVGRAIEMKASSPRRPSISSFATSLRRRRCPRA
jgi:hypothetical protein